MANTVISAAAGPAAGTALANSSQLQGRSQGRSYSPLSRLLQDMVIDNLANMVCSYDPSTDRAMELEVEVSAAEQALKVAPTSADKLVAEILLKRVTEEREEIHEERSGNGDRHDYVVTPAEFDVDEHTGGAPAEPSSPV